MTDNKLVPGDRLYGKCDLNELPEFKTTEEFGPLEGMIGQKRAVKAMNFGLSVKREGFNIYMAGIAGTGKMTFARSAVKQQALKEDVSDDWCYVYNFKNEDKPIAINFPAGEGRVFKEKIEDLIEDLQLDLGKAFESDDYEQQKAELMKKYQNRRAELFRELEKKAEEEGFALQMKSTGIMAVPIIDGEPISMEEYEQLDDDVRDEIQQKHERIQQMIADVTRKNQKMEKEIKREVKELDKRVANYAVGHLIDDLNQEYSPQKKVLAYLDAVKNDIIHNIERFKESEEQEKSLPIHKQPGKGEDQMKKYKVNLLIDNGNTEGAPVVVENNPTYYNLVGKIEYQSRMGAASTDFTMIKPGALHQANGGYLILRARDLLTQPQSWEALKRTIRNGEIRIENIGEQYGLFPVSTLKPELIPLEVKVILVGNPKLYHLLYQLDEDFQKLFKIKADFDTEMPRNKENIKKMVCFINTHCQEAQLKHFNRNAVANIVEYSSRLASDQQKLTTRFNEVVEILYEAEAWAEFDDSPYVQSQHVTRAIEERIYRSNQYEEKIQDLFKEGTLLLDVEEEVVGQVNGLAVLNTGDYSFGKPSRITAAVKMGDEGVVNIEREAKMSGKVHNKGVMILSSYLGWKYGQSFPLSLTATLTFEQLYDGVDGDSASAAELYALLSSISGVPIRQGIAVTGSVNQRGQIQPVGGVTEKVEGYFKICRMRGLQPGQGVIIPEKNIRHLNLDPNLVQAVEKGSFNIYAIKHIEEGFKILTGREAGEMNEEGEYPEKSLNYLVQQKLKSMAEDLISFGDQKSES